MMNNNNFENIPRPRYVREYRKFNDMFRIRRNGERGYLDKLIMQSFISLVAVAVILLINSINTSVTNYISEGIKNTIDWNINLANTIDTFSNIRNIIPEAKKNLDSADDVASPVEFIMPVEGEITSEFGERVHPVFKTVKMHTGIDIDAELGTPIKSSSSGKVIQVGEDTVNGKYIRIQSGKYEVIYIHCHKVNVKEGQSVKQGDIIGEVGDTGLTSGPHLHFEIQLAGEPVNPLELLGKVQM